MSSAAAEAETGFAACFGTQAEALFSAPARINLIGEHTDYNEGFVLPAAIDRRIHLAVRRRDDTTIRVVAGDLGDTTNLWDLTTAAPVERDPNAPWSNYLRGVSEQFRRHAQANIGLDIYIRSDIPAGAGLSSSAALCAAFACALDRVNDVGAAAPELARWCQAAEHEYLDSRCGIMDQLASLLGLADHALLIDCRSLECRPVRLPRDATILVVESGQSHRHAGGAYNERRAECEAAASALGLASLRDAAPDALESLAGRVGARVLRRARHVLSENERTLAMAAALETGDYATIAGLMAASQRSMRDDFEISTPAIDALVGLVSDRLEGEGGARMTGGGFGGSVVVLAPGAAAARIDRQVVDRYHRETGLAARVHRCFATDGARRE